MSKRRKIVSALILVSIIGVMAGSVLYLRGTSQDREAYKKKFECGRVTWDIVRTDIFCDMDKFFNPEKFTDEEIREYYNCSESRKIQGVCNDSEKLRQKFYKEVSSLK